MRRRGRILEELLVVEARAGNRRALEELVRLFHPRLMRLAAGLLGPGPATEDVVQEAWLGIVQGIGRLQDPERFRSWAFQVAANKCRDWIRRRSRERQGIERFRTEPAPAAESPTEASDAPAWGHGTVRAALAELPSGHRAAMELYYLEELSVADIARTLGIAPGTVKSRLFHARRNCRLAMERAAKDREGRTT